MVQEQKHQGEEAWDKRVMMMTTTTTTIIIRGTVTTIKTTCGGGGGSGSLEMSAEQTLSDVLPVLFLRD